MTKTKQYERIPQTFAFREFVYGQPARGFTCRGCDPRPKRAPWWTTSVVKREWQAS